MQGGKVKPRIVIDHAIWCCFLPNWKRTRRVGFGYSPKAAYDDWKAQRVLHV
jgi:hypothetical protein